MEKEHSKAHSGEDNKGAGVEEEKDHWLKGPARFILALFLLLIIVSWAVPYYSIKLNPEPTDIPSLDEIESRFLVGMGAGNETRTKDLREAVKMTRSDDPLIKQIATRIAAQSCPESQICHAKALYYFVRDNIKYVSDPYAKEYIAFPDETLKTGGGDCEDGALLLAAMMESIGIKTRIVVIPGHAFIKAEIAGAPRKYKINDEVYMDWTCGQCGFGEIPYKNILQLSD